MAALAFLLTVALSAGATPRAFTADTNTNASVKLTACKSNAYYANRELSFRATMARANVAVGQTLQMRVNVLRKFNRDRRFTKIKADGLGGWTTATNADATAFQRDVDLSNPDTAAVYRASVTFRWLDPATQKVQAKKTVVSRACKQKVALPQLSVTGDVESLIPGSSDVQHSITLTNHGPSEAEEIPLAVYINSGGTPIVRIIASLPPKSSYDSKIETPPCLASTAYVVIDPLKTLPWLPASARKPFYLAHCN